MAHSGIREIANEALRRPGTIRLDVGQPDFPTPQHVKDAGKRAIDENKTFYTHTQGLLSLREKLVEKLERVNGIKTTPENIACGPGGVGALAATLAAVVEQGDEVLLPDPGWPNYRMMLPWLRVRGVFYPCPPAAGFQPDLEALEQVITPRSKVLVVNSPNNPTGAVYPLDTITALIELAQEKGWDVDYFMCCLYYLTRPRDEFKKLLGENLPLGEIYLPSDPPRMFATIKAAQALPGLQSLGCGPADQYPSRNPWLLRNSSVQH